VNALRINLECLDFKILLGARGFIFGRCNLQIYVGNANIATGLSVCCYSLKVAFTSGLCGEVT